MPTCTGSSGAATVVPARRSVRTELPSVSRSQRGPGDTDSAPWLGYVRAGALAESITISRRSTQSRAALSALDPEELGNLWDVMPDETFKARLGAAYPAAQSGPVYFIPSSQLRRSHRRGICARDAAPIGGPSGR